LNDGRHLNSVQWIGQRLQLFRMSSPSVADRRVASANAAPKADARQLRNQALADVRRERVLEAARSAGARNAPGTGVARPGGRAKIPERTNARQGVVNSCRAVPRFPLRRRLAG